jgi:TRAP-type C4-dicarboxylate transport system permease large subunit
MVIFFIVFGFLLLLGCIMDNVPAIIILAPIFTSLALGLGYDSVHFGFVVVYTLLLGLLTPPVGMVLYVTSDVAKIDVLTLSREVIPFVFIYLLLGVLLILFPQISLSLPHMQGR